LIIFSKREKKSQNITFKCSFKQCRSLKIKQNFSKHYSIVRFWWKFYQQKRERTKFSVIILKYFLEAQILNIHDLNTNLNYLSSNVLSLYCIAKSIRSLWFFYYIFHIKPHFLKTLFQSRLLFDFDDLFTNKNRIKCIVTVYVFARHLFSWYPFYFDFHISNPDS
jgi:hypothetical protein